MTPPQAGGAESWGPAVARRGAFGLARAGLATVAAGAAGLLGPPGSPPEAVQASDEWCDTDPLALDITSASDGRVVVVAAFYLVGVKSRGGPLDPVRSLLQGALSSLGATCTARTGPGGGTEVEVTVTVPALAGGPDETRLRVCAGPQCLVGQTYGTASGVSGAPMTARFTLPAA